VKSADKTFSVTVQRACAAARQLCELPESTDLLPRVKYTKEGRKLLRARGIAVWLLTQISNMSTTQVAPHFNFGDHTSVLYARNRISEEIALDSSLGERLESIAQAYDLNPYRFSRSKAAS
jgi:hypothetical protein